ncbi:MAG: sulfite exporter TauE/SafE family protein [Verrucomicrobiales bacterium]
MLFAAFFMGLVGSLHCAVMCGPLVMAVPVVGQSRMQIVASRMVYHLGRIALYTILGALFGLIGKSLLLAGFQQWLSIFVGVAMLAFLVLGAVGMKSPMWKTSIWLKSLFENFIHRRSYLALFVLGAANGLLPCGLVYMAGTASIAAGGPLHSALYMICFGLGTLPMLLGMAFSSVSLMKLLAGLRFKAAIPIAVTLVAFSLILRGMGLGIPYLSPAAADGAMECAACINK